MVILILFVALMFLYLILSAGKSTPEQDCCCLFSILLVCLGLSKKD